MNVMKKENERKNESQNVRVTTKKYKKREGGRERKISLQCQKNDPYNTPSYSIVFLLDKFERRVKKKIKNKIKIKIKKRKHVNKHHVP